MSEELTMLPVADIYPHPDNPRKDVGDVTELADSIAKRGILQNLTVMPGHWMPDGEWSEDGYTTLIGHRRTAAAKLAGIESAPCRIVTGLTKNEQISMMLEENMQRNDLTIYEQAESFQLMLDLGDTVESLSEKTGFAKSTIYHRLNLAKLDHDVIKEKENDESFQMSLKDMYELEKIDDVKERNRILSKATSSSNLKYEVERTVKEQERKKRQELIEEKGRRISEIEKNIKNKLEEFVDMLYHEKIKIENNLTDMQVIIRMCMEVGFEYGWEDACGMIDENFYDYDDDEDKEKISKIMSMAKRLPVTVHLIGNLIEAIEEKTLWQSWNSTLNIENATIYMVTYPALKRYGFQLEEDELKILKGTHPLYTEIADLIKQKEELS